MSCCNCIGGQGGAFCKHLCAVELKYGLILQTSPKISSTDRVICANLASNDPLPEEFYHNMNNELVERNENMTQDLNVPIDATVENFNTLEQPPICSDTENTVFPATYNKALTEMKETFKNLTNILENHPSSSNLKAIHLFNNSLKNVVTDQQAQNFIFSHFKKGLSRKIHVQPTSVARRSIKKVGTKNRIQAGRPSTSAPRVKKNRKRKHDLAFNVSENVSNAR